MCNGEDWWDRKSSRVTGGVVVQVACVLTIEGRITRRILGQRVDISTVPQYEGRARDLLLLEREVDELQLLVTGCVELRKGFARPTWQNSGRPREEIRLPYRVISLGDLLLPPGKFGPSRGLSSCVLSAHARYPVYAIDFCTRSS